MTANVFLLAPEILLVIVAVLIYVLGAFVSSRRVWSWLALGGIVVAAIALAMTSDGNSDGSPAEPLAVYTRWLALGVGGLLILAASRPLDTPGTSEYIGSLLLTIAGVMLLAGAGELVLVFLGLELVSIPTYILLYLGRRDESSQEAATKYFFLSIFASAVLLYGFSFLYGTTGGTDLRAIHDRLITAAEAGESVVWLGRIAMVLILVGLGFKIAAVPFHFYAPDVYQGTTHANAAVLSVVPKLAGLIALVRIVAISMEGLQAYAWPVTIVLAIATMTLGNVMALRQENLRRLLAFSSIAHAGYMLIGFAVYQASGPGVSSTWDGVGALLLYVLVYAVATIGMFAALACLGQRSRQIETVEELAGLAWTGGRIRPALAWSMALFLFSLAGIPPLAGFWGKLAVLASAVGVAGRGTNTRAWFIVLAVVGVLNAAVAAAYYLRIVGTMFFRLPLGTPKIQNAAGGAIAAVAVCVFLAVVIGISPGIWIDDANRASPVKLEAPERHQMEMARAEEIKSGRLPSLPHRWEATDSRLFDTPTSNDYLTGR